MDSFLVFPNVGHEWNAYLLESFLLYYSKKYTLVNFGDENEMRSILQGYLEYGKFNAIGYDGESDAGVVFLGNIQQENMDEYAYMLGELPALFQETALLDRIHGFVKGWDIPRMNDSLEITGWALNSEYFCSIMHELRSDLSYLF